MHHPPARTLMQPTSDCLPWISGIGIGIGACAMPDFDLVTHSPDGESRGLMFRVGDIFPMDPQPHQRSRIDESGSQARPWGLDYLTVPQVWAGKHESDTSKYTTGGGDNQGPEDEGTD